MVLDVDMKEETLPAEALITDPEVGATFEELPDEDKSEFPAFKEALQRRRARGRAAQERVSEARKRASSRSFWCFGETVLNSKNFPAWETCGCYMYVQTPHRRRNVQPVVDAERRHE